MRNAIIALIICAFSLFSGCATAPSKEEIASADYGPRPENPKQIAKAWIKAQLKDPKSARFDHYDYITQGYSQLFGETAFGYIQCGTVNAKNSFGGYTGSSYYFVTIKRGSVIQGHIDSSTAEYVKPAQNVCNNF